MRTCRNCGSLFDTFCCKVCQKTRSKKWAEANPEKIKLSRAKWYEANQEKIELSRVAWLAANPEKHRLSVAKWQAAHPNSARVIQHNRRAKQKQNGGKLSTGITDKLFKLQRGKCACCGKSLGKDYHLNHKMPIALGGANEDRNMQLLRKHCNHTKSAKHPVDFMQERGFL